MKLKRVLCSCALKFCFANPVFSQSRLSLGNETLDLKRSERKVSEKSLSQIIDLKLVAGVQAPVFKNKRLQAVAFSTYEDRVAVSYAFAGDTQLGAIDLFSIYDRGKLKHLGGKIFPRYDLNDVVLDKDFIFATGAEQDRGAGVLKFPISDFSKTFDSYLWKTLPSYAGTSIGIINDNVYVTTGDKGGLYELGKEDFVVKKNFLNTDARDFWFAKHLILLSGRSPHLLFLNQDLELKKSISLGKPIAAESKAQIISGAYKALLALNDHGTKLLCLRNEKVLFHIPAPFWGGFAVSNSAAIQGHLVAVANGEAGLNFYLNPSFSFESPLCGRSRPLFLGTLNLKQRYSANHVHFYKDLIFLSDGSGGFKVIKYTLRWPRIKK